MSNKTKITVHQPHELELIRILDIRYPSFMTYQPAERILLVASVLTNDIKVREGKTNNHGLWIKTFLKSVGLDEGHAWCMAGIMYCHDIAQVKPIIRTGGVKVYVDAAKKITKANPEKVLVFKQGDRSDIAYMINPNGTGHCGIVAGISRNGRITTYEGNTGPDTKGSQRDGDGWYKRTRPVGFWQGFIEIPRN